MGAEIHGSEERSPLERAERPVLTPDYYGADKRRLNEFLDENIPGTVRKKAGDVPVYHWSIFSNVKEPFIHDKEPDKEIIAIPVRYKEERLWDATSKLLAATEGSTYTIGEHRNVSHEKVLCELIDTLRDDKVARIGINHDNYKHHFVARIGRGINELLTNGLPPMAPTGYLFVRANSGNPFEGPVKKEMEAHEVQYLCDLVQ